MGSVLGSLARRDKGTAPVLPNVQQPPDRTGFFQNLSAGFTQAKAGPHSTQNASAIYESRYYDQIRAALKAEGEQATDMVQSPVLKSSPFYRPVPGEQDLPDGRVMIPVKRDFANPYSEGPSLTRDVNPIANLYMGGDAAEMNQMWQAVQRVRHRKPGFLKDLPDQQTIAALAAKQRQADLAHAQAVTSRANTAGTVGGFIGGAVGSIASLDPEAFVGGFTAPAEKAAGTSVARQIVKRAATDAAVNTAAGVVAVPGQMADANRMGQPMTTEDAVHSVGENALAGAILGTAHVVIPEGAKALGNVASTVGGKIAENLPAPIRDPIVAASIRAGTVKDRDLLHEFQRAHNPYSVVDTSTPEERAAAHVLNKDIETQEQSPLQPSQAPAHGQRLDAIASALGVDLTPPDAPTTAPVQTATVRDHSETAAAPRRPASFVDGINQAEGSTRNPRSTADGYGNFIDSTWLSVVPKVANTEGMSRDQILALRHDKDIAGRATAYYAAQNGRYLRSRGLEDSPGNLSLAHFLGAGDAAKVLKADPSTPVESLLSPEVVRANHEVLQGKSADQVIAWAHKRIGATVDHAPARPDAVPDEGFDYTSAVPYTVEQFRPDELPPTSAAAPTDEPFNPNLAQHLLVWEREDGTRELIDGGKRLAHARSQEDQSVTLPSVVLREKEGISEEMAMLVGKLKNVNLGTTSLEEAAGILGDIPEIAGALRNPEFRSEIAVIAQLPHERFGEVVNGSPLTRDELSAFARPAQAKMDALYYGGLYAVNVREMGRDPRPMWALRNRQTGEISSMGLSKRKVQAELGKSFNAEHLELERLTPEAVATELRNRHAELQERLADYETDNPFTQRPAASGGTGEPSGPEGRDLALEAADADVSGSREPSLFDRAIAARDGAQRFSDPVGPEVKAHTDMLEHDLRPPPQETRFDDATIKAAAKADHVHISAREQDGAIILDAVERLDGSKPGSGAAAIRAVLAEADRLDMPVRLRASALLDERPQAKLRDYYRTLGFEEVEPDSTEMVRPAKNAVADDVHLFDLPSTGFRLSEEGDKPVSLKQALDEADADEAAAKALRDCL